ncbi:MAG: V-type ATP synthase subunit I [Treponema sp.]
MIVSMKKVSIVVLSRERKEALRHLKKVGVMHLESLEGSGETLSGYKEEASRAFSAAAILEEIKNPKKVAKVSNLSDSELSKKCAMVIELSEIKKKLLEEIASDSAELERLSAWGEVDPDDFSYLDGKNVSLRMFEIPEAKYDELSGELKTVLVNRFRKIARFLLIDAPSERPSSLPPEAFAVPLPGVSTKKIKEKIESSRREIASIEKTLSGETVYRPQIESLIKKLEKDIQFENVYSGMGKENGDKDTDLAWLTGFVPVDSIAAFKASCAENSWAYAVSDPSEDDEVPTKLKNNPLVSLIYPLTDFLGTVPGYREYDISGWFLLFFTVFFGMIFGDGGYGLLVFVLGLFMALKDAKKGGSPIAGLVTLLGLSTVVWGTVTCTWFGLTPEQLPAWLKGLSVPPISNAYSDVNWLPFWTSDPSKGTLTTAQNLQIFCFTLAFLQLSVAHFKGIARNIAGKSLKWIGEFGSLLQLWGMFYVVLSMVVSSTIFGFSEIIYGVPVGKVSVALVGVGFSMSFVFSNYEGNIGESIMASVKGIISVLLGVVNVFSDIVSYIRLWAVGLAGAAISNTVNSMAGPLLGHAITFLAFVVLILFGHGLNMILNLLSVIVHGVRLNTLEFSTHLGMSWSGFKYSPFCEKD